MQKLMIEVVLEKDKDGYFAYCPSLQGCYTQGLTYEETLHHMKDAILLHLADRKVTHQATPSPEAISVTTLELAL